MPRRRYVARRNRLIERHLFLLPPVAHRLMRSLPTSTELDELIADGAVGLLSAAIRFERARGVPFARFATRYIRGAMIDGVRQGWRAARARSIVDFAMLDPRFDQVEKCLDARAIMRLESDNRRRLVLVLYYLDQLTMKRIGRMLGVSEARVSQLVNGSLRSLRQRAAA
jgi:RNA polymerase sigma factor (sigma-70 family)